MKGPFCVIFVFSVFFWSTNEQCPTSSGNSSIISCEGSTKYGSKIYIDFYRINNTCTCTLSPSFDGELLVTSREITHVCYTQVNVQSSLIFGCSTQSLSFQTLNVQINDSLYIRAEYASPATSGTFYHCLGFQQNGGLNGNLSVVCRSPPKALTTTVSSTKNSTATLTSTQLSHASSPIASSIELTSVVNNIENKDVTLSSSPINASNDYLSMETSKDDPEMLYIIAGSAGGGAIILVGLIVLILVLINGTRSARNENESTVVDIARTNEVFDSNPELPDNPLYISSQPMDEFGYSSDHEKQLGLPPTNSKTKIKINSNYEVPPNNKPIDHGASSMLVYAVPKRSKDCRSEVSTSDVYADVCKPNRSTAQDPVRKHNEDGLLYLKV